MLVADNFIAFSGKVSRMLAAKAALAIRYDALAEGEAEGSVDFAIEARTQLEKRARELELRKAKLGGHRYFSVPLFLSKGSPPIYYRIKPIIIDRRETSTSTRVRYYLMILVKIRR